MVDDVRTGLVIRHATEVDVPDVVTTHLHSFKGFFLTFLGPAFLNELYSATLQDTSGIGFVAESEKSIYGFVMGTTQPAGFYRRLLRNRWWRFGCAAVQPILRRPTVIPRLLRAFSMPRRSTRQAGCGTLMSIAVLPKAQGQGVGRALVHAFLKEARCRGLEQVDLTTDKDDNEAVNRFYQKLGFSCVRTFITPENRAMNEYVITLDPGLRGES
jgi:ribosomal protein S18 acetylase RimI-like enzyme